ncbi:peptide synthase, partial [Burkholderia pseudomallei]
TRVHDVTHFSAWGMRLGLRAQAEEFESAPLPHLKPILTGTDVPDVKTVQRWVRKSAGVQGINAWGPTEATCAASAHVIREIE